MITCKLGEKNYCIDFISGRALRELEPAAKMYARIVAISNAAVNGEETPEEDALTISEAMDVMVKWFCLVFKSIRPGVWSLGGGYLSLKEKVIITDKTE